MSHVARVTPSHDTALHRIEVKFFAMPLRKLFFILLFANLLLLSGGYMGWLGDSGARGEPERLTNQLHPEYIRPGPLPQLPTEASQNEAECVTYTLAVGQESDAEHIVADIDGPVTSVRQASRANQSWRVHIPRADNTEAANSRARQLNEQGIKDLFVIRDHGDTHNTISLGLFSSEKHALQRLESLHSRGVSDAELVAPPIESVRIEFRGPQNRIKELIQRFDTTLPDVARHNCAP